MPPFSILSLHNAETTLEYKREAEFCTLVRFPPLGSHPHSLFPYLDLLVSTHIAIQGYFLVTIYLFALTLSTLGLDNFRRYAIRLPGPS